MSEQEPKVTICAECQHFISIEDGPRTGVWYNLFCGAIEQKPVLNVVTGKRETPNDNGHPCCREVNNGNCKLFEPRKSMVDRLTGQMARILGVADGIHKPE